MTMKKAFALITVLALAFLTTVMAVQYIKSNLVTVTVQKYKLTLTVNEALDINTTIGELLNFTGTLTLGEAPVPEAYIELFYANNDTTTGKTDTTAPDGSYSILWNATAVGTFTFYTNATIS